MACLVVGGILLAQTATVAAGRNVGAVPLPRVAPLPPAGPTFGSSRPAALVPPPTRLRLPRLHVDATVLPVSVGIDGLLGVPANPRQLGWWSGSARPGLASGSVVIDGHVDSATLGLGAFFRLSEARPGDEIVLENATGESSGYTVVARRSYAKASLPVAEVFAMDVPPRLVLLTCGGAFDQATHHYADNIVVYAVPR
ncbi:MAG: class F sortase [Dermatophilaceae bacterium]